ncbi:hypothetical protein DH2020_047608 [Rehmannia glutinosa]|uniref:Peptidase S54 rhomboid domain-containing protein n=1 Tax=Rehmannia glutinosa TaxID=99300 RepID=A0ABR0U8U2_REHGL
MGKPLFYEIWEKPATSCIIGICSLIWLYIQKKSIGYSHVGLSYATAMEGHHWRIITSAFSHISILHLVFNMSALWSLGVIEQLGHQPSSKLELFGFLSLPISFAPFESLVFTSIIVPQASFIGHLSGIIIGYAIAWGLIHGMNNYWAVSMLGWIVLVFIFSLKKSGTYNFNFLEIESVTDPSLPSVRFLASGNGRTLQMSTSADVRPIPFLVLSALHKKNFKLELLAVQGADSIAREVVFSLKIIDVNSDGKQNDALMLAF